MSLWARLLSAGNTWNGYKYTDSITGQENAVRSVSFQRVEVIDRPLCRRLDKLYHSQNEAPAEESKGRNER